MRAAWSAHALCTRGPCCALTVDTSICLTGDASAAAATSRAPMPSLAAGPCRTPARCMSSLLLSCAVNSSATAACRAAQIKGCSRLKQHTVWHCNHSQSWHRPKQMLQCVRPPKYEHGTFWCSPPHLAGDVCCVIILGHLLLHNCIPVVGTAHAQGRMQHTGVWAAATARHRCAGFAVGLSMQHTDACEDVSTAWTPPWPCSAQAAAVFLAAEPHPSCTNTVLGSLLRPRRSSVTSVSPSSSTHTSRPQPASSLVGA